MTVTGPWLVPVRPIASYLVTRFPPHTQGAALLLTFTTMYLLYGYIAGAVTVDGQFAWGAATFVLLFLALRLVDDLDDLDDTAGVARAARRSGLKTAIITVTAVVGVLNVAHPPALFTALAAIGLVVFAPFVLKRALTRHRAALALGYESGPLVMMVYAFVIWHDGERGALPAAAVVSVVGFHWGTYEFWKFSRRASDLTYRPYRLHWTGVRAVLVAILALLTLSATGMAAGTRFPAAFDAYLVLLSPAVLCWTLAAYRRLAARRRGLRLGWSGLVLVALSQTSLIAQICLSR